jgi:endo-1,4-beta-mannosidase
VRRGNLDAAAKPYAMARFLLGVNYWPRSGSETLWSRFDLGEIDDDLAHVGALGFAAVRFFLPRATFAPAESTSQEALDRFEIFLDRLDAHGLRALPAFAGDLPLPAPAGDFYGGDSLEAQRALVRAAGERARDHAALLVWDIGNEFSRLHRPRSPGEAAHWSAALSHDLFETSNAGSTGGLFSGDITEDRGVRPSSVADSWSYAAMQGSPGASGCARNKLDTQVVPFLCEVASSFARKPVLVTACGNPTCDDVSNAGLSEEEMAAYARKVLDRLQHRGALGAFWQCWTDSDGTDAERTFGIVRHDGSEKAVARVLGAFAAEERLVVQAAPPLLNENDYYARLPGSLGRAYTAYLEEHDLSEELS